MSKLFKSRTMKEVSKELEFRKERKKEEEEYMPVSWLNLSFIETIFQCNWHGMNLQFIMYEIEKKKKLERQPHLESIQNKSVIISHSKHWLVTKSVNKTVRWLIVKLHLEPKTSYHIWFISAMIHFETIPVQFEMERKGGGGGKERDDWRTFILEQAISFWLPHYCVSLSIVRFIENWTRHKSVN